MRFVNLATTLASIAFAVKNPDEHNTFQQLVLENGWAAESYTVTTKDGYVSSLYRISGKPGEAETKKPAVLMMHGMQCDMNFWLANDADLAPPFTLAEHGYDVWLGNNRGNRYAKAHVDLSADSKEFWQFSQEQMGLYDVPAFIDFILAKTGQEKLTYVGHSQGTTQMFIGTSLIPDYYASTVNLFVALAPVVNNYYNPSGALREMGKYWREMEMMMNKIQMFDMIDANWWEEDLMQLVCAEDLALCSKVMGMTCDSDPDVDNMSRIGVFLKDVPAGNGYLNSIYYAQDAASPDFLRFNYGPLKNKQKYDQADPPKVPLQDISIPIALVSGTFDLIADPADVAWLAEQVAEQVVFNEEYPLGHMSFTLAKDMSWFDGPVLNLIDQYATNNDQNPINGFLQ